ncbi:ankyrin repeat protein, putative [Trichomonas vaginalis G3]|uniref:Ankyrin repeat protein, putative n=1 Tax=Trichomonas vaginalis (strain ATCC PRA-98 / G3) TaxID=412133 RepID=A2EBP1_TRIV3|nr:positive regulation of myosin-light-chain-phosphatase protein [Trichomonas vaginalis G3]EAY09958.1 ankyrin repeat protein, putative [Trichomonas vaginalis G3]KAI5523098.1 positive regulation of myosin-light-chain-phosphatase protein [Trichomonas vaginalis G3]|eukprot:XP_001322181.1 ankyrin repeat protein [Trichomonas vaginalis G3]
MFALHNKCLEIAELLLSSGADINAVQENGYSALHLAVGVNDLDTIKFLVYHHANINLRDYDGLTAYFHACDLGYNDIKLFFEQNGAM